MHISSSTVGSDSRRRRYFASPRDSFDDAVCLLLAHDWRVIIIDKILTWRWEMMMMIKKESVFFSKSFLLYRIPSFRLRIYISSSCPFTHTTPPPKLQITEFELQLHLYSLFYYCDADAVAAGGSAASSSACSCVLFFSSSGDDGDCGRYCGSFSLLI